MVNVNFRTLIRQLFHLSFSLSIVFAFIGCKKESATETEQENAKIVLSIDSTRVLPGDIVMMKSSKTISVAEVNITLSGRTVKGYASGDSAYVFTIPVIAPGALTVAIPDLQNANTVGLTVKDYTPISNPQTIIDDYISRRDKSIDSITKVVSGSNFQPSAQSITLLNQLKEEWDLQINKLAAHEKELLAYVLQRNLPEPAQYGFEAFPNGYFAKAAAINSNVGDQLVAIAKNCVTAQTVCLGSIPFLIGSGVAFIAAPNPISAVVFLGVFTTFVISREVAIRRAEEVGRLKGVAEAVTEVDANRTVEFSNSTERALNMSVDFRNLATNDAAIQADVAKAFSIEKELSGRDRDVEILYGKAAAKSTRLKGAYPSYQTIIGNQTKSTMSLSIDGKDILVKGVSDPRIGFSTTVSGTTKKVKITSNSTTEINFNLQIAYKRTLDGKEFTKDITCLYKPEFDSTAIYTASAIGKYRVNNYKGNGPNSVLYCELIAGGKTEYSIYGDPSWADGTKFNASWSITKQNGKYYYSESGFWHYGFPNIEVNYPLSYPVTGFQFHNDTFYQK
jgi:hypothetical protein